MPDRDETQWARYVTESGHERVDLTRLVDGEGNPTHMMCCICFEYIPLEDLWTDESGQRWDVCKSCNLTEQLRGLTS